MEPIADDEVQALIGRVYQEESRDVLATLIRLLGDFDRAEEVAMAESPATGLALIDTILARGELADCHLAHATRADLCRRLGRADAARAAGTRALALARQESERRFLARRLEALPP